MQWVIVYFPSGDLTTAVVGPFRSHEKATDVCERLEKALDGDYANYSNDWANRAPSVVMLSTEREAIERDGFEELESQADQPQGSTEVV